MLSNCGAGEDAWEFLGLQGDQASQSYRKSTLNIHWKDWCWSWNSNILATWCEELTQWKRPWCWERLKAKRRRGRQRMRCLDSITDSMDMNLSQLWKMVEEAWFAAVHGVTKSQMLLNDWKTAIFFFKFTKDIKNWFRVTGSCKTWVEQECSSLRNTAQELRWIHLWSLSTGFLWVPVLFS